MEYNYVLTTEYDGEVYSTHRITDFTAAAKSWEQCVDSGNANEFARYTILDPAGLSYTKSFYVKG
jgi:hypothetical protein